MIKILIVEDELNISSFIQRGLSFNGYSADICNNGQEAWERLKTEKYDLIIADIMMPYMSGLELCSKIRTEYGYATPVILLTAFSTTDDIVNGLNFGADDYITKPFKIVELDARIKALLRRSERFTKKEEVEILSFADLDLNTSTKKAHRNKSIIDLTAKEYLLLEFFMQNPNKVLSRQTILENVWDINFDTNTNIVDVYINYVRNKIQPSGTTKIMYTVIGQGYILREE